MKPRKQNSPPQDYSVNALSKETGRDRRTIDKAVANLTPVRIVAGAKHYRLEDVQAMLEAKPDKTLKDQKLAEEVRKLKIKNDRDSGVLVSKAKIVQFFNEFAGEFRGQLHQVLENEYPTVVAGMDPPQARILGKRLADKLDEIGGRYAEKLETIE